MFWFFCPVQLREDLNFAHPVQILKAVQILCFDGYGSMVWNLSFDVSEQFCKDWKTTVKLVYGVPRSTCTYLVEGHFAAGHTSLRNQMLYQNMLNSPIKEVRTLVWIISAGPRSVTCSNIRYLQRMTGLSQPQLYSSVRIKISLPVKQVPESEKWRLGLLDNLMKMKQDKYLRVEDSKTICAMIDSLCNTWDDRVPVLFSGWPHHPLYMGDHLWRSSFFEENQSICLYLELICSNKLQ